MGFRTPWSVYQDDNPPPSLMVPDAPPVERVPTGSGLTNKYTGLADWSGQRSYQQARFIQPAELQNLEKAVRGLPSVQAQEQSLAGNRELLRMGLQRQPVVDIATPLANLSDYVATGRLGTRQAADPTADYGKLRDFAEKLQDDQRDISNTVLRGVSASKVGYDAELEKQKVAQTMLEQAADPYKALHGGNPNRDTKAFFEAYQKDVKPIKEAYFGARNALGSVDVDSPQAYSATVNFLARASGEKGPLSDADRQAFQGSLAIDARLERAWQKLKDGRATEVDKRDMRALGHAYLEFHKNLWEERDGYFIYNVAPNAFGIHPKQARGIVVPSGEALPKPKAAPAPGPDIGAMFKKLMEQGH